MEGRRLNQRYVLERKLGEGGMGAVFLARDELAGGAPVALKLVQGEQIGSGAALAYFRQEFRALAALRHPNLAAVFDFGAVESIEPPLEEGAPRPAAFFTAEYVDGLDLHKAAARLSFAELCDLTVEVLRALAYVHARGLIHHDVKPSNILVATGKDGRPTAKLLDFGLVGEKTARLDGIKGTVRYLAPEVARGAQVDERADLYSLGVTLYQVTTRQLPFEGESTLSVIRKHLDRPPEPPRALRKDLPPGLDEFILKLMAKEPADRYASADEAIEALARATGRPYARETPETIEARVLSGRFVGREGALARLRALEAGFLLVTGEQGIGRTRLLRELKHALQLDGKTVVATRATGAAWSPWPDVVRQLRGTATFERAGGDPSAGAEARRAIIDSVATEIVEIATRRGCVLLVDDLGDADRNALEIAAVLARSEPRFPIVATARAEGGLPAPLADLAAEGAIAELPLERLAPGDVAALVDSMLGAAAGAAARLAPRVAAETGGNPFFVEQVMKAIAEDPAAAAEGIPLPATVGEALARRLAAAPDGERRALEALALFARPARAEQVAALVEATLEDIFPRLRALERRGLVAREGGTDGAPLFSPASARLREIVAALIPHERALAIRAAAVRLLEPEAHEPERTPLETLEALAEHARAAGDRARTARYALAAAARARALHAYEKAVACYTLALESSPPPETEAQALAGRAEANLILGRNEAALRDAERARLDAAAGRAKAALGDAPGAREAFERALEAARARGDEAAAADALREIGNVEFSQGRYEEALAKLAEAHRALEALGDRRALARVLRDTASCLIEKGSYEHALECARAALAIEREAGDEAGLARTLRIIAQTHYYRGAFDDAVEAAREAIARSEAIGHAPGIAAARNQIGHILHARGRTVEARESYEAALRIWRRIGDRAGQAAILNNLGCIAETLAEYETAIARYDEAARIFEAIGYRGAVALAFGNLASASAMLGRLAGAEALAARSLQLAATVGNKRIEIEAKRVKAEVRLRKGDLRGAREAAHEAAGEARALGNKALLAAALRALGAAARDLGRAREARESLEEALAIAADLGEKATASAARVELARLAIDDGRPARAFDLVEQARSVPDRAAEVEALRAATNLYLEVGDLERADRSAREAAERVRALAIGALEAEARLDLARVALAARRLDEAKAALEDARGRAAAAGQAAVLARAAIAEAGLALARGDGADAEAAAAEALRGAAAIGAPTIEAEAALARGEAALLRGDPEAAAARGAEALRLAEELGRAALERRAHALLGRAAAAAGRAEAAARHFRRAIALAQDTWFELRGAWRETFLAHPENRALEAAALALVRERGLAPAPAAAPGPASPGRGRREGAPGDPARDPLTGLLSHTAFTARLDEEIARARRHGRTLALLKANLEGFRELAENAGTRAARGVVERLGALLAANLREIDLCGRYFADEFEILLPETDEDGARLTAERLARAVEAADLAPGTPLALATGIAVFPAADAEGPPPSSGAARPGSREDAPRSVAEDREALVQAAETALRQARSGEAAPPPEGARPERGDGRVTREGKIVVDIVNTILATDLDLDRLLELVCRLVCDATRAERGFVMLRDADGRLVIRAGKGFDPHAEPAPAVRVSTGIAERVAREVAPVLVAEATEDDRFRELRSVVELRLRSIICAPLSVKEGESIGVLYVDHNSIARKFTRADLHLLVAIAKKIAPVIASSKRLREKEEELESVREKLLRTAPERVETKYSYDKIIGRSAAMQRVFQLLDRVVDTQHPVVIHGESGTGKELVARAIHYNGPRKLKPFVAENCAALSETLLEAELFGHVKGAFTGADRDNKGLFELANGGTLFLDEIGDMSERMQKKLLRVLQEGEVRPVGGKRVIQVDVRVISASNKDLRKLVAEGAFREDLFYRLNVITVTLPPLRERKEDIPLLVEHFLKKAARGGAPKKVEKEVYRLLMEYDWPGNVRELENEVLRIVAMSDETVDATVVSPKLREGQADRAAASTASVVDRFRGKTLREIEEEVVREVILKTLEETNWHRTQTAELLGLPTSTLFNKMRKLGIG